MEEKKSEMWRTLGAKSMTSGNQRRMGRRENYRAVVVKDMNNQKNSLRTYKTGVAMTERRQVIGRHLVQVKQVESQPCDEASETNEL
jgi:hypothetical protein